MKNQHKHHSTTHMLIMILGCIAALVLVYVASKYFGFGVRYVLWTVIILCIGMHIWMMKGHKGGHNHG